MSKFSNYTKLLRLHQPTGIWLLFLPCLFGISLAIKKLPSADFFEILRMIFLFLVGSIVMRSAGCVINDLLDQKFDKKVARTKSRPLAAEKVSRGEALNLLALLLFLGFLILLQFNSQTILSGFFALILVATYPLMKRITNYPQIFLGLTFNFGILMSGLAILGEIDSDFALLYFSAVIWTVIYDTIYAYQDIEDDLRVGVKSAAIKFGQHPKKILILLALIMTLSLIYLGWQLQFELEFFLLISFTFFLLSRKIKKCDFKNSKNCLAVFKYNFWIGILILTAITFG
jgi:4-hydroxybenzoate polyprenyl transferase